MTKPLPPPDRPDNGVDSVQNDGRSPMQRFTDLARGLVNVSREDLEREQAKYDVANQARKAKLTSKLNDA